MLRNTAIGIVCLVLFLSALSFSFANQTVENTSLTNITNYNLSNITSNVSLIDNLSLNISKNITQNITNITSNVSLNITLNTTNSSVETNNSNVSLKRTENFYRMYKDIKNKYHRNKTKNYTVQVSVPQSMLSRNISSLNDSFETMMTFDNLPVESIEFRNLMIENDTVELGIEELNTSGYVQSYAIDPERMEFDNATVTVTAKGTKLYKCALWNFSTQTCGGDIVEFMNTTPGETYTFILTPKDPAFFESVPDTNNDGRAVNGVFELNTVLRIGNDAGNIHDAYFRFETVDIPAGAEIRNATLNFTSTDLQNGTAVNVNIYALQEASCSQFNTGSGGDDPTDNARTTAFVAWDNISSWTDLENSNVTQSPNISSVIQEVVDLPGWAENNSLCFVLEDDGSSTNAFRDIATTSETEAQLNVYYSISSGSWWDVDFLNRKEYTINNSGSTELLDFPIFLNVEALTGMDSNYDDLRFVNGSCTDIGSKEELDYELELTNSSNALLWIRMPNFAVGSNNICMYYNNDLASPGENASGVWSNEFDSVWHFSETGTSDRIDSTGNGNDAAPVNYDGDEDDAGILGNADRLDGTDDYLAIRNRVLDTALSIDGLSVCALINSNSTAQQIIASYDRSDYWRFAYVDDQSPNNLAWDTDGAVTDDMVTSVSYVSTQWQYVCATFNSSVNPDKYIYINGTEVLSQNGHSGGSLGSGTDRFGFIGTGSESAGFNGTTGPDLFFNGRIDELRISNVSRSADWINQTYQLIVNQDTAVTEGDEDTFGVLSIVRTNPTGSLTEVTRNEFFSATFNVSCNAQDLCGDFDLTLYYNGSLAIGETATANLSNFESTLIPFQKSYDQIPLVIGTPVSDNNDDNNSLIPVINDINTTHMNVSICEDAGATSCSSVVEEESVHFLIFDRNLSNSFSWIEVGTVDGPTDGTDTAVTFNKTFSNIPYIFAQVQSPNDGGDDIAPHIWAHTISTTAVTLIGCEHPGTANACGSGSTEVLGYVAIDVLNQEFLTFASGLESIDDSLWIPITYGQTIAEPIIAVLQNDDAGAQDPQYAGARNVTSTGADIRYCEQDAAGVCNTHAAEDTVWMVFQAGLLETTTSAFVEVSTTVGATPLYTTSSNPQSSSLNESQSESFTFTINASGDLDSRHTLYAGTNATVNSSLFEISIIGDPEVFWNDSTLNFTDPFLGEVIDPINTSLTSINSNTNVSVVCSSGNCSSITTNFTNGISLASQEVITSFFTCSTASVGYLTALFNVTSNEDTNPDQINVTCNVTVNPLTITLINPSAGSSLEITQNTTRDVEFNITCQNSSGCANVDVALVYEGDVAIGEAGSVTLNSFNSTLITFTQSYTEVPVMVAIPATDNRADSNPYIVNINDVNRTHANVSFCQDAGATTCATGGVDEEMHYFVFDPVLANTYSWIEVGKIDATTNGGSTGVTYNKTFSTTPYFFATPQTDNDGGNAIAPHAWALNPTTTSIDLVACDHPGIVDTCAGTSTETFGYVAIDVANHEIFNFSSGTSNIADSTWTTITFSQTFSNPRIMVLQNSETGGQDPQYPMARSVTSSNAEIRYCEADGAGDCDTHNAEDVRWFTVEDGPIFINDTSTATLVPTVVGSTPFFTTDSNPQTISLLDGETQTVSFTVNATGDIDLEYNLSGLLQNTDSSEGFILRIVGFPRVFWSVDAINFSTGFVGENQEDVFVNVSSVYANTNLNFTCESGNCSDIVFNTSFPFDMVDNEIVSTQFLCQNSTSNNFTATYRVNSTEDSEGDLLNLSCVVLTKEFDIDVTNPLPESLTNILQNQTINVTFDILCNSTGACGTFDFGLYYVNDTSVGEAGSISLSGLDSTTIAYSRVYDDTPVVIVTPATDNLGNSNSLIPSITEVNRTHVTIASCHDAGNATCDPVPITETYHYMVFDKRANDMHDWIEVGTAIGTTNGGNTAVSFNKTFSNVPYVFGTVQSDNDLSGSIAPTMWAHSTSVTATTLIGCEHPGTGDSCGTGRSETLGYVAIDVVTANLSKFSSGTESIANSDWTTVTFSETFTNPRIMVLQNSDAGAQDPQYPLARSIIGTGGQVRYCEQDAEQTCDGHANEDVMWLVVEEGTIGPSGVQYALISTTPGDTPFFTTDPNTVTFSLDAGNSTQVSFLVNASGESSFIQYELIGLTNTSDFSEPFDVVIEGLEDLFQIYYGNIDRSILLAIGQLPFYLFGFNIDTGIFAYDVDANISFDNLTPIGRTTSGTIATNDFAELDTLFNISLDTYQETIQSTFASDASTPLRTKNISTNYGDLNYLPIINSTNTTSFQTGILWDASDDSGNNEFDTLDNEDIVFITQVNSSQVGSFGTYDYEIAVPETLANQFSGSSEIEFFTEQN